MSELPKWAIRAAEDAMLSTEIPEPSCTRENYRKCPGCSALVDRCAAALVAERERAALCVHKACCEGLGERANDVNAEDVGAGSVACAAAIRAGKS